MLRARDLVRERSLKKAVETVLEALERVELVRCAIVATRGAARALKLRERGRARLDRARTEAR